MFCFGGEFFCLVWVQVFLVWFGVFFTQEKVNYKMKLPHHFCKGKVPVPSQAALVTSSWSRAMVLSVQLTQLYLLCTSAAQMGAQARQTQRAPGASVPQRGCELMAQHMDSRAHAETPNRDPACLTGDREKNGLSSICIPDSRLRYVNSLTFF